MDSRAIAISCSVPSWYTGARMQSLAPTWTMVNAIRNDLIDEREYTRLYLALLRERELTAESIIKLIPDNSILLCYESPGEFCHRRVLAEWLEKETGIEIPELKTEEELKKEVQDKVVDSLLDF